MSPGNYDPFMAHLLAQAEFDAAKAVGPGTRMGAKLSARGRRLLQAEKVMEPRGRRIPWWVDPEHPPRLEGPMAQGNATADALAADETAAGVVALPGSGGTEAPAWTQTARRARRKIGMIGEEASHA